MINMSRTIRTVRYRRKREGKTDYNLRLKLLMSGRLRLVIRKTNKGMCIQVIQFNDKGDTVLASAHTAELKKLGWTKSTANIPSAYLLGVLIASKAKKKGIKECIPDLGLQKTVRGTRIFAAIKGAADGGLKLPYSPEVFPKEDSIKGAHMKADALFVQIKSKIGA